MLPLLAFALAVQSLAIAPGAPAQRGAELDAEIRFIAALAGEPRRLSAAAITRDDVRLQTLENSSPFARTSPRRVVIVPALNAPADTMARILDAVRWFKTQAPAAIREQWTLSALLAVDPAESERLARWLAFQGPDLVIEVGSPAPTWPSLLTPAATTGLGRVPVTSAAIDVALRSSAPEASPLRTALTARAAREPLAIARLLAAKYPQAASMSYIPALAWVGSMRLSQLTGEPRWMASVREQVRPWLAGERAVFGQRVSLTTVAGTMVFAHLAGVDSEALPLAVEGATRATGRKADGTAEYGGGWTDDMFMATSVLARTAALDGRAGDLDTAARLIADYAQRLQRPDGLFIHAAQMPAAWGRGNGFAALALAEALTALPATGPARQTLLAIYRRQMKALAETQAPDGAWTNVVDEPGAYREASATAMLFTAVARGIRLGWLDRAEYLPVAQRAWTAVAVHVAEDGSIVDVCESTPGGSTRRYYLDRRPITGADDRGGAMALLAALERHELGS